jgi:hypothetical protein
MKSERVWMLRLCSFAPAALMTQDTERKEALGTLRKSYPPSFGQKLYLEWHLGLRACSVGEHRLNRHKLVRHAVPVRPLDISTAEACICCDKFK